MSKAKFEEHLRKLGLRLTPERNAVLQEVASLQGHFEPEEVILRLRRKGVNVSRASVYRTLPLLVASGIIEEAIYKDRKTRYEKCAESEHHDHLICTSCGKIIEFVSQPIELLQEEVCRRNRFRPSSHTLEIRGLCDHCTA